MVKKCIICGEEAVYKIKNTPDYYCPECAEDIIDSIENGNVGQLLMDISICKGKITAFEKFLEINEKELLVVFEDTEWDYYQLVGALEATDGQLDTTYNEFSEAQSLYYNS